MLTNKVITNKFYLYKTKVVKIKKIHKSTKSIVVKFVTDDVLETIPMDGANILLTRLYTIGELAKITEKRSDTIRKYERQGLISRPDIFIEIDSPYKNWRFYKESEVYDVVGFFSGRVPGRPVSQLPIDLKSSLKLLKKKVENI